MSYHITHATEAQLPTLLHLAEQARNTMRSTGNTGQWVNGYPSREVFLDDIAHRASMIVSDDSGAIVGTFAFLPSPEPTYNYIDGQWLDDNSPYYVIHRIASMPGSHGVLRAIIDYAFTITDNVRIDTHRDNVIMRHLLPQLGFTYCGIIYLANGDERLAYQQSKGRFF